MADHLLSAHLHRFVLGDSALCYMIDKRRRADPWQAWMAPLFYGGVTVLVSCSEDVLDPIR